MPKKNTKKNGWTQAGTFDTYEEADTKRKKIGENSNVQTKVRRRHSSDSFTVHYRNKPEQKKAEKK